MSITDGRDVWLLSSAVLTVNENRVSLSDSIPIAVHTTDRIPIADPALFTSALCITIHCLRGQTALIEELYLKASFSTDFFSAGTPATGRFITPGECKIRTWVM